MFFVLVVVRLRINSTFKRNQIASESEIDRLVLQCTTYRLKTQSKSVAKNYKSDKIRHNNNSTFNPVIEAIELFNILSTG